MSGQPGRGGPQLPDSLESLGSVTRAGWSVGRATVPLLSGAPVPGPPCPPRESLQSSLGQAELVLPGQALGRAGGRRAGGGREPALLGAAVFSCGRLHSGWGVRSHGLDGERVVLHGSPHQCRELRRPGCGWVVRAAGRRGWAWPAALCPLTSCTVKSRQGPTSSRYTLPRKGLFLSKVGDSLQAWNSANSVVSTCGAGSTVGRSGGQGAGAQHGRAGDG